MAALSQESIDGLAMNMARIQALRSLEFILNVREAMPSDEKAASRRMVDLVCLAYPDDEDARGAIIEALSRG